MAEKNYGQRSYQIKKIIPCPPCVSLIPSRRISVDNPDWLKATNHYYHRGEFTPVRRDTKMEQKQYDVMGHKKLLSYASKTEGVKREPKMEIGITPKIGDRTTSLYKVKSSMP